MVKTIHVINLDKLGGAQSVVRDLLNFGGDWARPNFRSIVRLMYKKQNYKIFCHLKRAHLIGLILLFFGVRKNIYFVHHSDIKVSSPIYASLFFFFTQSAKHIFVSYRMMDDYQKFYALKRVSNIKNPVLKLSIFEQTDTLNPVYDYGFVGRLDDVKNVKQILKLFSVKPNRTLCIIGDGPLRSTVEDYCTRFKNISYLGQLPREKIYNNFNILVLASKREVYPCVILEGIVANKSILVTRSEYGIVEWSELYGLPVYELSELPIIVGDEIRENRLNIGKNLRTQIELDHNIHHILSLYEHVC